MCRERTLETRCVGMRNRGRSQEYMSVKEGEQKCSAHRKICCKIKRRQRLGRRNKCCGGNRIRECVAKEQSEGESVGTRRVGLGIQ